MSKSSCFKETESNKYIENVMTAIVASCIFNTLQSFVQENDQEDIATTIAQCLKTQYIKKISDYYKYVPVNVQLSGLLKYHFSRYASDGVPFRQSFRILQMCEELMISQKEKHQVAQGIKAGYLHANYLYTRLDPLPGNRS